MKKSLLKSVNTQVELGNLIQSFSKDPMVAKTAAETGYLSMNDASSVAKVVSNAIQKHDNPYSEIFDIVQGAIYSNECKIKPEKAPLAMEIMAVMFRDSGRWYIFSQSKKMMARVINNDKTPIVKK